MFEGVHGVCMCGMCMGGYTMQTCIKRSKNKKRKNGILLRVEDGGDGEAIKDGEMGSI